MGRGGSNICLIEDLTVFFFNEMGTDQSLFCSLFAIPLLYQSQSATKNRGTNQQQHIKDSGRLSIDLFTFALPFSKHSGLQKTWKIIIHHPIKSAFGGFWRKWWIHGMRLGIARKLWDEQTEINTFLHALAGYISNRFTRWNFSNFALFSY